MYIHMIYFFTLVGVCTCTTGFFKIIDRIERPRKLRRKYI